MKILIAGGGTGGHVFTGLAIVQELLSRKGQHKVCFVGSPQGIENKIIPKTGHPLKTIHVLGLKGMSWPQKMKGLFTLPRSFWDSLAILLREKPDVILGVGGYASGPIILLGALLRIPTAIIEQNSIPGFANRLLSYWVKKIFLAFDKTKKYFPRDKCLVTGNPVRKELFSQNGSKNQKNNQQNIKFHILVFGGSQGARRIDRAMQDTVPHLKDIQDEITILHQSRGDGVSNLSKIYHNHGLDAKVVKFIDDMKEAYEQADLVVCRAGALSVSEIATLGKAAILVPYPFAADNHQEENAKALAEKNAAILLLDRELSGRKLSDTIHEYFYSKEKRQELTHNILHFSSYRAAQTIVDSCLLLMGSGSEPGSTFSQSNL